MICDKRRLHLSMAQSKSSWESGFEISSKSRDALNIHITLVIVQVFILFL